jgi:hypothetical protein
MSLLNKNRNILEAASASIMTNVRCFRCECNHEYWLRKNLEGDGHGHVEGTILAFA